jgi:dDENN domain
MTYRSYIDGNDFRASEFTASLNLPDNSANFVRSVVASQMFHGFIDEATENEKDPSVLFFDASINAKINRSKKTVLTGRKKETSFLKDNGSMVRANQFITSAQSSKFLTLLGHSQCFRLRRSSRRHRPAISACQMMAGRIITVHSLLWIMISSARLDSRCNGKNIK